MDYEYEDDLIDYETEVDLESDVDAEDYEYAAEEVDDMLDALMLGEDEEDFGERRRRRRRSRRGRMAKRRPVRTAAGRSAYRAPVTKAFVTQNQLKDALGRVGKDIRRNAMGIKSVNTQLGRINGQLRDVVTVNGVQNGRLNKVDKQLQLDGALEFAQSFTVSTDGGTTSLVLNFPQILKGAVKSGMLGDLKGTLANPLVIGGIGLLLNNPQVIGGLLGAKSS